MAWRACARSWATVSRLLPSIRARCWALGCHAVAARRSSVRSAWPRCTSCGFTPARAQRAFRSKLVGACSKVTKTTGGHGRHGSRAAKRESSFPYQGAPQEIQAFIQPIEQIVQVGNPRGKPLDGDAGLFPLPASFGSLSEYLGQEVTGPLQPAEGRGAERRLDAQRFFFQQDSQRRGRGRVIIEGLR